MCTSGILPGATHSPCTVATSGPLPGARGVPMSGAIDGQLRGAPGQPGKASGGVGCLRLALGCKPMICIEWRRERRVHRVFSGDLSRGRKPEKLRICSWAYGQNFRFSEFHPARRWHWTPLFCLYPEALEWASACLLTTHCGPFLWSPPRLPIAQCTMAIRVLLLRDKLHTCPPLPTMENGAMTGNNRPLKNRVRKGLGCPVSSSEIENSLRGRNHDNNH